MISPGSSFLKSAGAGIFPALFYELVSGKRTGEGQCDTGSGCADLNTAVKAEGITHCFDELLPASENTDAEASRVCAARCPSRINWQSAICSALEAVWL